MHNNTTPSAHWIHAFQKKLLNWHEHHNHRALPWKGEKDPYKIWLSEILLQQTRAEQAESYYTAFVQHYPTISDMANAQEEVVFKIWQGLGYYSRCRNMLATAKFIHQHYNNQFPQSYDELLKLKGVGPYTAAAIGSFAFNLPYAVVDGNVYRILSRLLGIATPIDSTMGKKQFSDLAQQLLASKNPSLYNQAIMDFGATICTPKNAKCTQCVFNNRCVAYLQSLVYILPVKEKKTKVQHRYFNYFIFTYKQQVWTHKRSAKDIWQDLHEFYLIESTSAAGATDWINHPEFPLSKSELKSIQHTHTSKQKLTHQLIEANFYEVICTTTPKKLSDIGQWVSIAGLQHLALPKTIQNYCNQNHFFRLK